MNLILYLFLSFVSVSCLFYQKFRGKPNDISLNLAFVHMRKAGGTTIRDIVGTWMRRQGCDEFMKQMTTYGIEEGQSFTWAGERDDNNYCPNVNIVHNEISFVDGQRILDVSTPIGSRKSNLRMLTMLRHPIKRVISQAFYNGFGSEVIYGLIVEMCNVDAGKVKENDRPRIVGLMEKRCAFHQNHQLANIQLHAVPFGRRVVNCTCIFAAQAAGRSTVRGDDPSWLGWMEPRQRGFFDSYMDNYYIKRLVGFRGNRQYIVPDGRSADADLLEDLWGVSKQPSLQESVMASKGGAKGDKTLGMNNFGAMRDILDVDTATPMPSSPVLLEKAKELLEKHFDILILELLGEDSATKMLNSIIGGKAISISSTASNMGSSTGAGAAPIKSPQLTGMDVREYALKVMLLCVYCGQTELFCS